MGLLLEVIITAASVQDRDAAKPLLWNLRRAFPSIKLTWAGTAFMRKARHLGRQRAQAHRRDRPAPR